MMRPLLWTPDREIFPRRAEHRGRATVRPVALGALLVLTAIAGGCGVQRSGIGGLDASRPDAARGDSGLLCAEGTVDLNGDPEDGCECTVSTNGERCNGADDDCDGRIDEELRDDPRIGGSCDGDDDDLCMDGVVDCVDGAPDCVDPQDPEHVEVCDDGARDEDCDGDRNEGCSCTPGSDPLRCGPETEMGLCVFGTQECMENGQWGSCQGAVLPNDETCDNRDEDCDGRTDENVTEACANRCGTPGLRTCAAGSFGRCDAPAEPMEVCNGADDDCDGSTDEGVPDRLCSNACGQAGTESCVGGRYQGCTAPPVPLEDCNGVDDDCDGSTDEGVSPPVGLCNSTGVCAGTTPSCSGASGWECNYPSGTYEDPEMSCDSLDNDCDGAVDEGITRPCTDACGRTGTETCVDGSYQGCTASGSGGAETCNATDDDCDGSVDEDADCGDCTVVPDPSDPAHTYLFCTTTQSWGAAAADCMLKGYHLADLETEAEHGAVWAAAQGVRGDRNWWFGIHHDSADSQWEWTDGTAAYPSDSAAYDGWASDQPDRNTCGFLWQAQGGDWKAGANCGAMLNYVCEAGD